MVTPAPTPTPVLTLNLTPSPIRLRKNLLDSGSWTSLTHRRSQDFQLGGLEFKKSYPTARTDPENFGEGYADLN